MTANIAETLDMPAIKRQVDKEGYCVIPDALNTKELEAARSALERIRAEDKARNNTLLYGPNKSNQRIWGLLNRSEDFVDLAIHPVMLKVMRELLGFDHVLLSTMSANITGPGGDHSIGKLHIDQGFLPNHLWPMKVVYNSAFFLDDYTEENGATVFVPKSNQTNDMPPDEMPPKSQLGHLTGRAGSLAVWDGFIHHATGLNRTANQERRGIIVTYTAPFMRTHENWSRSLDRSLIEKYPELADVAGFVEWSTMGGVNGGVLAGYGLNY